MGGSRVGAAICTSPRSTLASSIVVTKVCLINCGDDTGDGRVRL
jgi:hypothetical protein